MAANATIALSWMIVLGALNFISDAPPGPALFVQDAAPATLSRARTTGIRWHCNNTANFAHTLSGATITADVPMDPQRIALLAARLPPRFEPLLLSFHRVNCRLTS